MPQLAEITQFILGQALRARSPAPVVPSECARADPARVVQLSVRAQAATDHVQLRSALCQNCGANAHDIAAWRYGQSSGLGLVVTVNNGSEAAPDSAGSLKDR